MIDAAAFQSDVLDRFLAVERDAVVDLAVGMPVARARSGHEHHVDRVPVGLRRGLRGPAEAHRELTLVGDRALLEQGFELRTQARGFGPSGIEALGQQG